MAFNYWAVLVAAVAQWLLGWAWYGPMFGKTWMALSGQKMEGGSKSDGTKAMMWGFVSALVMSAAFAYVIALVPGASLLHVMKVAILLWLGFVAATMINSVLYEKKSLQLFWINSGYYLVALVVMGLILAAWR